MSNERIVKVSTPAGNYLGNLCEHPVAERAKKVFVLKQAASLMISPGPNSQTVNINITKLSADGNFKPDLIIGWSVAVIMDLEEKGQIYGLYKNAISPIDLPTGSKIASPNSVAMPGPRGMQ